MQQPATNRLVRSAAMASLGLLASGLLAPSAAQGGCHLDSATRSTVDAHAAHFEFLPLADPSGPSSPARTPGPCPGGICSPAPAPPAPTSPKVPTGVEQWPCLSAVADLGLSPPKFRDADEASPRPLHLGPSIDRPPRLARTDD